MRGQRSHSQEKVIANFLPFSNLPSTSVVLQLYKSYYATSDFFSLHSYFFNRMAGLKNK